MENEDYTGWFAYPYTKPFAVGVYEVVGIGDGMQRQFSYWNGEIFTAPRYSPENAYNCLRGEIVGNFAWRGLIK